MNNNHQKIEDEYFDYLKDLMGEIGLIDKEQQRKLKNMKENIRNFEEVIQLKEGDFMNVNDFQLAEKLGVLIPKSKNSN